MDDTHLKTIVYVDGFNLFYGLLKHSNHKWLDLYTLFQRIIHIQNPESELVCVKYYTAPVMGKFASHGSKACEAQDQYHRALNSPHTNTVHVINGSYTATKATPMRYKNPPDKTDRVTAWKLEEKQTDVNLALDMYRDAIKNACDQIVVCTNDSDIVPALKYIKSDAPTIVLGGILPRPSTEKHRPITESIRSELDWMRKHIRLEELAAAQFPDRVPTRKKPVTRPDYW